MLGYTSKKKMQSKSFDGLHIVEFDEETHRYKLDGKRVVGATTVGNAYPKGEGLIRWMIQQGIEEYDKKTKMKEAASIGTVLHDYAYCIEMGKEFDMNQITSHVDSAKILNCIAKFNDWKKTNNDIIEKAEIIVASPSLSVCGKFDTLRRRGTSLICSDYKTAGGIYVSAFHQTALYRKMCKEWLNLDIDALEIVKFGKSVEDELFEVAYVDNKGLTLNGNFIEYKGLMDEMGEQAIRNVLTYRHQSKIETLLRKG